MKTNSRAPSSKMKKTEEAHRKMHFKNNFSTCDPFKIEKKKLSSPWVQVIVA